MFLFLLRSTRLPACKFMCVCYIILHDIILYYIVLYGIVVFIALCCIVMYFCMYVCMYVCMYTLLIILYYNYVVMYE